MVTVVLHVDVFLWIVGLSLAAALVVLAVLRLQQPPVPDADDPALNPMVTRGDWSAARAKFLAETKARKALPWWRR